MTPKSTSAQRQPYETLPAGGSNSSKSRFPRLSRSVPMMRPEYDVVVVGSGYGGGVAASRMARAGKSVVVLEMGKEKWPGEYPSTLTEALPELHVSGNPSSSGKDIGTGKPTGLYNLVLGEGQNAFVAKGLGGTSLLNANVFLECDKRSLALSSWPQELREDVDALDEYYSRAAQMLQPSPYPSDYPPLQKLSVLEKQAKALGYSENFYRVPQTTFFTNEVNNAGVQMHASTGSGQDCTGVNDGSKNSVLMNYLADAWNWGAEIFCECEVRYVKRDPSGKGYIVYYAWHGDGREHFKDSFYNELMWVRARELCFLGAGALGTTEILLRSRAHGLKMSPMVGQKLSGNGDVLSFGYNTDKIVNGVGRENPPASNPPGPTITGVIDNRGPETSPNVLDGYVIEEGAIPAALAEVLQPLLEVLPGKQRPKQYGIKERIRHGFSSTKTRFLGPYAEGSSVNRTQTYLIMSHDSNEGILTLKGDKPHLEFLGVGRTEHVKVLNEVLAKATSAVGGTFINSPFYAAFNQQVEITVHPLGGAIMSSDGTGAEGVTNHVGQVFKSGGEGREVYEGLVCVDGAVIPTALGVNPLATITALAERSVHLIARQKGRDIDLATRNERLNLFGTPARPLPLTPDMEGTVNTLGSEPSTDDSMHFTEIMDGHIYIGDDIEDFTVAENAAKGASSSARFYLSVDAYNVETLIKRSDHSSLATGTFSCGALSKDPLLVLRGEVQFFTPDLSVSNAEQLVYKLTLLSTDGQMYLLNGYKMVDNDITFSVSNTWKATTTLSVTITKPDEDGRVVGRGKLYISWRNFESELKSFGGSGLAPQASFIGNFARNLVDFFVGPFRKMEFAAAPGDSFLVPPGSDGKAGTRIGYLKKPEPLKTVVLKARDGVETTIRVWSPVDTVAGKEEKIPVLMVPGASVDHQIFAMPTIPVNCVDYFTGLGYKVYIVTPRFGITPTVKMSSTPADAALDVLAAMEFLRNEEGGRKFYAIVHCQGAVATSVGMLNGSIPVSWMAGMSVSQVFFRHKFGKVNQVTGGTTVLPKVYRAIAGPWYPVVTPKYSVFQWLVDQILRFYPVGPKEEIFNSAVCHRLSLLFGRLWRHENLNRATHNQMENFITGTHTDFITNLLLMGEKERVLDAQGKDTLLNDENLGRFEGLPILLFSGGSNVVYDPVTTSMCYDDLRERFPGQEQLYRRSVIEGYGHLDNWMGKEAYKDVFPVLSEHLEWCVEREAGRA
ncbi:FAD/NAD(P)-binding domain-containing protein [Dendrothele bispora CBS 962.96]|uniref:Cholesterol oxidase n=1 Tax=Dendrothele bispora (strain CBS 962.96) TaxID=1314807 RepID=A0A4S8M6D2_DENBC|nr:FAD/NAD(P)-binding domain-containing protein [Dendrothele bispora CBS 962.96]